MMTKKVAIIGGGVVGLAAALFLKDNFQVTIFEREEAPKPIGAGIMLQPSGISILDKLGLAKPILQRGQKITGFFGENNNGKVDFDIDFNGFDVYGYGVQRGSIYFELLKAVKNSGITLQFGKEINRCSSKEPFELESTRGDKFDGFDMVLVVNGARSSLRQQFPELLQFEGTSGQAALWTKVKGNGSELMNKIHQYYNKTKIMTGLMPIGIESNSDDPFLFNFFTGVSLDYIQKWESMTLEEWKEDVRTTSDDLDFYLDQITSKDQLVVAPYHDVQLKKYSSGKVIFIGDAAHAMGPHLSSGTNLGLIDAYVLSQELNKDIPVEKAFKNYEKLRKPQLTYYQIISRVITPFFQCNIDKSVLRTSVLSTLSKIPGLNRLMIETITGRRVNLSRRVSKEMYFDDSNI